MINELSLTDIQTVINYADKMSDEISKEQIHWMRSEYKENEERARKRGSYWDDVKNMFVKELENRIRKIHWEKTIETRIEQLEKLFKKYFPYTYKHQQEKVSIDQAWQQFKIENKL